MPTNGLERASASTFEETTWFQAVFPAQVSARGKWVITGGCDCNVMRRAQRAGSPGRRTGRGWEGLSRGPAPAFPAGAPERQRGEHERYGITAASPQDGLRLQEAHRDLHQPEKKGGA